MLKLALLGLSDFDLVVFADADLEVDAPPHTTKSTGASTASPPLHDPIAVTSRARR